jgi:hypothetical protein
LQIVHPALDVPIAPPPTKVHVAGTVGVITLESIE